MPKIVLELEYDDDKWKHPMVYLIWKKSLGADSTGADLVVIHTDRETAERRVRSLNQRNKDYDYGLCRYLMERVPLDHLFASKELGITDDEDPAFMALVRNNFALTRYHEEEMDNLKSKAAARIKELERQIEELKHDSIK